MNTYDAALPAGTEPAEGHKPRPRSAAPGSERDALYAARYTRLEGEVSDGVRLELVVDHDNGHPLPELDPHVERVIGEETPPEARRPRPQDNPED